MEQTKENQFEEITDFPMHDSFNTDCMKIEKGEGEANVICHADKQAERGG